MFFLSFGETLANTKKGDEWKGSDQALWTEVL